jgi:large conductance mechanosensitive channel
MVRSINSFRERFEAKKEEENAAAPPPAPPADIVLLTEIRDLLKK